MKKSKLRVLRLSAPAAKAPPHFARPPSGAAKAARRKSPPAPLSPYRKTSTQFERAADGMRRGFSCPTPGFTPNRVPIFSAGFENPCAPTPCFARQRRRLGFPSLCPRGRRASSAPANMLCGSEEGHHVKTAAAHSETKYDIAGAALFPAWKCHKGPAHPSRERHAKGFSRGACLKTQAGGLPKGRAPICVYRQRGWGPPPFVRKLSAAPEGISAYPGRANGLG